MRRPRHDGVAMTAWLARCGLLAVAVLVSSCAGGASASTVSAPAGSRFLGGGISPAEGTLRHYLASDDSTKALQAVGALPRDELLRLLHRGLIYHRAGAWAASNRALEEADKLADERYTKSLRQQIGKEVLNDAVADYVPPAHERAFLHYYGMLNYLHLGQAQDALVEARRANEWLARYARDNGARSFTLDGTVEYLAALLHLAGGDANDGMVSLRKASDAFENYSARYGVARPQFVGADVARVARTLNISDVERDAVQRYGLNPAEPNRPSGTGDLLVLVENGFIAHRAQEKLYIALTKDEVDLITYGTPAIAFQVGTAVMNRTITLLQATSRGDEYAQPVEDGYVLGAQLTGGELASMAWPHYRLYANAAEDVQVKVDNQSQESLVLDDLSAIAARSFEEEKASIMRRALVRAVGKYALSKILAKAASDKVGGASTKQGKFLGSVTGLVTQSIGDALESADTRSWSTLPAEVRAARFSLPVGTHRVSLTILDADGATRSLDLGNVTISANKLEVRSAFVTGQGRGSAARFARAVQGTDFGASSAVAVGSVTSLPPVPAGPPPGVLASVTGLRLLTTSSRPLANEPVKLAVQLKATPAAERRGEAQLTAYVARPNTPDTVEIWSGREGDTLSWNGLLGTSIAPAGTYTWIVRAATPRGDHSTQFSWNAALDVIAPKGLALTAEPDPPKYEPETHQVMRPDESRKHRLFKSGLVWAVIGGISTSVGYSLAVKAINSTPPGSSGRSTSLYVWTAGALMIATGGTMSTMGLLGSFPHAVDEPDLAARQRNAQAAEAHNQAARQAKDANDQVRNSVVMRVRPLAERRP